MKVASEIWSLGKLLALPLFRHWKIWEWTELRLEQFSGRSQVHRPTTLENFWFEFLSGNYKHGDTITFRDWFVTEWFPAVPGRYWKAAQRGERQMVISGGPEFQVATADNPVIYEQEHGCVRLPPSNDTDMCAQLCLIDAQDFLCERGIPVVVDKQTYSEYLRVRRVSQIVAVSGQVRFIANASSAQFSSWIDAVGIRCAQEIKDFASIPLGIPSCHLRSISTLDLKFLFHPTSAKGLVSYFVPGFVPKDQESIHMAVYGGLMARNAPNKTQVADGLTHFSAVANLADEDELREVVRKLEDIRNDVLPHSTPINDFDGVVRRLACSIPIAVRPKDLFC